MRSPLKKELEASFSQDLQKRFPQFRLSDRDRGWLAWAFKISPDLTFFVTLQAMEREDQFVVEAAWSEDGEFPWGAMGKIEAIQPQGRERLARLWESCAREPVWDLNPEKSESMRKYLEALGRGETADTPQDTPAEQLLPRVSPLVQDAMIKLERHAIPLFRQVAETRGVAWPPEPDGGG